MKQNVRLIKQNIWFDKIEPLAQIKIMKVIALNGFLSKKNIVEKAEKSQKLVDATVGKMLDKKNKLIQPVKREKEDGTKKSTFYSLTEKGIKILVENSYEENEKNDDLKISGKKYLNLEEIIIFVNRFKKDYVDKKNDVLSEWQPPSLTQELIEKLYCGEDVKLYITLIEQTRHKNSRLKNIIKQFRDADQKINKLLDEIPMVLHETLVNAKK